MTLMVERCSSNIVRCNPSVSEKIGIRLVREQYEPYQLLLLQLYAP